jgi:3-methylcrotonyl-CoA carboxylase beta subunit
MGQRGYHRLKRDQHKHALIPSDRVQTAHPTMSSPIAHAEFCSLLRASTSTLKRRRTIRLRQCLRTIATHTHHHHAQQISIIRSSVDTSSADFKDNARQMNEAIERVRDLQNAASQGGTQKAREKHIQRGKMLPREYIHLLHLM